MTRDISVGQQPHIGWIHAKKREQSKRIRGKTNAHSVFVGNLYSVPHPGARLNSSQVYCCLTRKKMFPPEGKKHGHGQGRGEVFTCPFSRHNLWQGLVLSYDPHRPWLMTEKRIRRRMHSLPHYFIITNHNKKKCVLCNIKVFSYALRSLIRTFELMLEATFARLCKIKKCFLLHCARLFVPLLPFEQNMGSMPK